LGFLLNSGGSGSFFAVGTAFLLGDTSQESRVVQPVFWMVCREPYCNILCALLLVPASETFSEVIIGVLCKSGTSAGVEFILVTQPFCATN